MLTRTEWGSAPLEAIFGMLFITFLALGVVQAALVLYARNVVVAAAHEGARAAVELDRDPADAALVAQRTIANAAGGLVNDLTIDLTVDGAESERVLHVHVTADLDAIGPLPIEIPVDTTASAASAESL